MDQYVDRLLEGYDGGAFRIAWDTGNGTAGPAVETLTAKLPGEHVLLFTEVVGNFPNHHPDPTAERTLADLRRAVAEKTLDFAHDLDGDCHRNGPRAGASPGGWGDQPRAYHAHP